MKRPKVTAYFTAPQTIQIKILNWEENDTVNIYRAVGYAGIPVLYESEHDSDTFNDASIDPRQSYKYILAFNNADISDSIEIISINPGPPKTVTISEKGSTTFTPVTLQFAIPWINDTIDLSGIEIDGMITEGKHGNETIVIDNKKLL